MSKLVKKFSFLVVLFTLCKAANATPITLNYEVSDIGGGLYNYDFSLVLDNHDNTWVAGQGWAWFIFGDAFQSASPLTNFAMDTTDFPVGPWTALTYSSGGHNGPTFNNVLTYWVPAAIGDTLNWSGTSTANLQQGELLFTTLITALNGGVNANLEVANRIEPQSQGEVPLSEVPAPLSLISLVLGLACLFLRRQAR